MPQHGHARVPQQPGVAGRDGEVGQAQWHPPAGLAFEHQPPRGAEPAAKAGTASNGTATSAEGKPSAIARVLTTATPASAIVRACSAESGSHVTYGMGAYIMLGCPPGAVAPMLDETDVGRAGRLAFEHAGVDEIGLAEHVQLRGDPEGQRLPWRAWQQVDVGVDEAGRHGAAAPVDVVVIGAQQLRATDRLDLVPGEADGGVAGERSKT